jgi:hypothetical protein
VKGKKEKIQKCIYSFFFKIFKFFPQIFGKKRRRKMFLLCRNNDMTFQKLFFFGQCWLFLWTFSPPVIAHRQSDE